MIYWNLKSEFVPDTVFKNITGIVIDVKATFPKHAPGNTDKCHEGKNIGCRRVGISVSLPKKQNAISGPTKMTNRVG